MFSVMILRLVNKETDELHDKIQQKSFRIVVTMFYYDYIIIIIISPEIYIHCIICGFCIFSSSRLLSTQNMVQKTTKYRFYSNNNELNHEVR